MPVVTPRKRWSVVAATMTASAALLLGPEPASAPDFDAGRPHLATTGVAGTTPAAVHGAPADDHVDDRIDRRLGEDARDAPACLTGVALSPEGPVDGARIHAVLHTRDVRSGPRVVLPVVESRACGGFGIDLCSVRLRISELLARELMLSLRGSKPGHASETVRVERPFDRSAGQRLRLVLARDPSATGVVVRDRAGAPVIGARVWLLRGSSRARHLGTTAGPEGRLDVNLAAGERTGELVALHGVHGVSEPTAATSHECALTLDRALGTIRGQVRFPDGTPVPAVGVRIEARQRTTPAATPAGEPLARPVTDELGRFAAYGLEPGCEYRIRVDPLPSTGDPVAFTRADGPAVDLVVTESLLHLLAVDENGAPLHDALARPLAFGGDAARAMWLHPRGREPTDELAASAVPLSTAPPPRRSAWVEPGSFVLVEWTLPGADRRIDAIDVPAAAGVVRLHGRLTPARADRGIELTFASDDGAADDPGRASYESLERAAVSIELASCFGRVPFEMDGLRRLRLAPGRYRLRVRPDDAATGSPAPWLPFATDVVVGANGFTTVPVTMVPGAAIELEVRRSPGADAAHEVPLRPTVTTRRVRGPPRVARLVPVAPEPFAPDATIAAFRVARVEPPAAHFELSVRTGDGPPLALTTALEPGPNRFVVFVGDDGNARHLVRNTHR